MSKAYAKELTKVGVSRVCAKFGYTATREACLESLADVVRHFIENTGLQLQDVCEGTGRVIPGMQDIIPLIDDWRNLKEFAFEDVRNPRKRRRWHEPFPFSVPTFPMVTKDTSVTVNLGEQVQGSNVPSHLPKFPPTHTYKPDIVKSKKRSHDSNMDEVSKKKALDSKRAQQSLIRLEQESTKLQQQGTSSFSSTS
jgi:hypothetical protein